MTEAEKKNPLSREALDYLAGAGAITLYCPARAVGDTGCDDPQWIEVNVSAEMAEQLAVMQQLSLDHGLSMIERDIASFDWKDPEDDQLNLQDPCIRGGKTTFWFRAEVKHTPGHFETPLIDYAILFAALEATALAAKSGLPILDCGPESIMAANQQLMSAVLKVDTTQMVHNVVTLGGALVVCSLDEPDFLNTVVASNPELQATLRAHAMRHGISQGLDKKALSDAADAASRPISKRSM